MKKLQLISQLRKNDCGPCCLAMILCYYGYNISQIEIREKVDNKAEPWSMLDIKRTSNIYGMEANAMKVTDICYFESLNEPIIVFWNLNHFIVLEKVKNKKYYIFDPEKGKIIMDQKDFYLGFSKYIISFEKTKNFRRKKFSIKKKIKEIHNTKIWNIEVSKSYIISLLVSQGLIFAVPIILKGMVSTLYESKLNYIYLLLLGISTLMYIIVSYISEKNMIEYKLKLENSSMKNILSRVFRTPYNKMKYRNSGDIISRIYGNDSICEIFSNEVPNILVAIVFVIIGVGVILWTNLYLGSIVFSICILLALSNFILIRKIIEKSKLEVYYSSKHRNNINEGINSLYFILSSGVGNQFIKKWEKNFNKYIASQNDRMKTEIYSRMIQKVIMLLSSLMFIILSIILYIFSNMKMDEIIFFSGMTSILLSPINQLVFSITSIVSTYPNIERLIELVKDSQSFTSKNNKYYKLHNKGLQLQNIKFRYPASKQDIISNLNIDIREGENIAILGKTGVGKTTLMNLILGIENSYDGKIILGGKDICKFKINNRNEICYIPQESTLYDGRLDEYLQLFLDGYKNENLEEVVCKMDLEELFSNTYSYNSFYIDEDGSNLSAGQKQRLSLIRAFLKKYSLLILDEPTSHLDKLTAKKVMKEIFALDCTKIFITHDEQLLKNVDKIYELKDGKLIECLGDNYGN
ncbi:MULTISPECIES: peptidase domain-containing ABC transporter [unclassified Clostridium]|uniref:peptidase domain-containing ABC transporter n=1 Tax=unclassified Clostridium TaxID=2614128 RepID=UPI003F9109DF